MLSSNAFSFVNVMDKAADASYTRQTVLAHNIANVDTPNYKRSEVEFSKILERELKNTHARNLGAAVRRVDPKDLKATVFEDMSNFSYRIDRNNVDVDTESMEITSEQLRYQTVTTSITNMFQRFKIVTGS